MNSELFVLVQEHSKTAKKFFEQNETNILKIIEESIFRLKSGGKFLVMGNGGSASDSSHFVAELLGRFEKERKAIAAVDLTSSNATITAIANDYGYENVFARQIEGLATDNDIILGITTSGKSANILAAFDKSPTNSLKILLTSSKVEVIEKQLEKNINYIVKVPHTETFIIQEMHIMFLHYLARKIEESFV